MKDDEQLVQTADQVIQNIHANKDNFEFLTTGFPKIDHDLDGGLLKQELVMLGGATGIGKSYLASAIMNHLAEKTKCAYFSLEISNEMVMSRIIGSMCDIKPTRIRMGQLRPDEFNNMKRAEATLLTYGENLSFYDQIYSLEQITKEIKTNIYEFVVIDFIQNIIAPGQEEYARLSQAALQLQKLAKEANCCIMVLSQLSNLAVKEGGTQTLEYKGSGSIATVADLGFVIQKTDYDSENKTIDKIKLRLRKNRRGVSNLEWDLYFTQPGGQISDKDPQVKEPYYAES
jgi:replicative DNA helicase